jgi:hypothetical protein
LFLLHWQLQKYWYQTGISIKQFVKRLRPIRSGIVKFNGIEILAEPEIPEDVICILDKLFSGNSFEQAK